MQDNISDKSAERGCPSADFLGKEMLEKNQKVPLKIEAITSEGSGVGRYDDFVIFTPMTCPGDEITAHILKVKKSYAFAKAERIIVPGEARIEPDCAVYAQCGGCAFRHMRYDAELEQKRAMVDDALARIGALALQTEGILALSPARYRNKAQYPLRAQQGQITAGFFAKHSHRVVSCKDCLLEPEIFGAITQAVIYFLQQHRIAAYNEQAHEGLVRHIFLRCTRAAEQISLCLVLNGSSLPHREAFVRFMSSTFPAIKSIVFNTNTAKTNVILGDTYRTVYGEEFIEDTLLEKRFRISAASFYQVNHDMCEQLYLKAKEYAALQPGETLVDLYCGAGTVVTIHNDGNTDKELAAFAKYRKSNAGNTVIPASAYDFEATPPAYQRLRSGSYGSAVFWMQKTLEKLGYFKDTTATGYFGPMTQSALKRFQKANKLTANGVMNEKTYAKIVELQQQKQTKTSASAGT